MDNNAPSTNKSPSTWQALAIVWDILISIAVPTVIFGLGGRYLDFRLGTAPVFMGLGLALSLAVVTIIITRKAKDIAAKL